MRQTISVKFFARKDRAIAGGMIPISMRIGINRQRINITTKIHVKEPQWCRQEGRLKPKTRDAQKINDLLDGFRIKAFDCQRELMNEGKPITLENIKAKWFGAALEHPVMLMEVFTQHNERMRALVNKEFSPLTLERYETSFRHTMGFIKWKYKISDLDVKELKYEFISSYEFWLKSVRKCDHNTTMKYLSNFKKIVHICVKNGWLTRDPFAGFKLAKREVERPFLVEEELKRIISKEFAMPRLRLVRDILFSVVIQVWHTPT